MHPFLFTILSRSCPMIPASMWAVRFSSSIHNIRSISVISSETIGRRSSLGHSSAPDTLVPPRALRHTSLQTKALLYQSMQTKFASFSIMFHVIDPHTHSHIASSPGPTQFQGKRCLNHDYGAKNNSCKMAREWERVPLFVCFTCLRSSSKSCSFHRLHLVFMT